MKSSRTAPIRRRQSQKSLYEEDDIEDDAEDEDSVLNMLSALYEAQKKKTKPSGRSEFQKKKLSMYTTAREEVGAIRRDTLAFLSEIQTAIEDMKGHEVPIRVDMDELPSLLAHSEAYGRALLEEFSPIVEELSPRRSDEVNAASEALESLDNDRNMLRRRVFLETKEYLEQSLQEYEIAADAGDMIKRYKVLLRS